MNPDSDPPAPPPPGLGPPNEREALWGPSLVQRLGSGPDWETGSWMDSLFKELPPLTELPALGERYQDLVFLGEGAMAKVYRATDTLLLRPVALKVLKADGMAVLQEGRAQAKVEHPNVCRIYEVGRGFLVMELIDGPTLQALRPALTLAQKVAIARDVALGVHAAHQRDLVHLDLKPGNILVRTNEHGAYHPVVGDFGMVLTKGQPPGAQCPLGTPPFSSPEQLRGDPRAVDCRSDVYSMGVLLYVLITGRSPFPAEDRPSLLGAIARTPPTPIRTLDPGVPPDLASIIHKCMEKHPAARYDSAFLLAEDLDAFLRGAAVGAMPRSFHYRGGKWLRRNRWLALLGLLSAAAILGVSGTMVRRARAQAEREDWDHHFQLMVEDLRSTLDRCYRKPLHDVEPERNAARNVLQTIEAEIRANPSAAGPGHLALGQALLLLGMGQTQAQEHIQKAWDLGFRTEGARAWLAYALVTRHRTSQRGTGLFGTGEGASSGQLLEQARQLLAGRRNTEQWKVAHLLDLADLATSNGKGGERALQVARAFRMQVPDDLGGMVEEALALCDRATLAGQDGAGPAPTAAPAELLREAEVLMRSALTVAPSYFEAYKALARILIASEKAEKRGPEARRQLHEEIAGLYGMGLAVSPNAVDIQFDRLEYICTSKLVFDVETHEIPSTEESLLAELDLALKEPEPFRLGLVIHGICVSCSALDYFGHSYEGLIRAAAQRLQKAAAEIRAGSPASLSFAEFTEFAEFYSRIGGDPRGFLRLDLVEGVPTQKSQDALSLLGHVLVALEYQRTQGLNLTPLLDRGQALLQDLKPSGAFRAYGWLELAEIAAKATDTPRSWEELGLALQVIIDFSQLTVDDQELPRLAQTQLLLARHALRAGQPTASWLEQLDRHFATRFSCQAKGTRVYHLLKAERLFLGSLQEPSVRARSSLDEALRELDEASLSADCRTASPPNFRGHPASLCTYLLPRDRLHLMRGEICLAASRQARTPTAKGRFAALAEASFHRALRVNPNVKGDIQRIQQERICGLY